MYNIGWIFLIVVIYPILWFDKNFRHASIPLSFIQLKNTQGDSWWTFKSSIHLRYSPILQPPRKKVRLQMNNRNKDNAILFIDYYHSVSDPSNKTGIHNQVETRYRTFVSRKLAALWWLYWYDRHVYNIYKLLQYSMESPLGMQYTSLIHGVTTCVLIPVGYNYFSWMSCKFYKTSVISSSEFQGFLLDNSLF